MKIFLSIIFVTAFLKGSAQNLFDENHSSQFANYLFSSGQYEYAAEEFERLHFLNPANDTFKLALIKSYRKSGRIDFGLKRMHEIYADSVFSKKNVLKEFAYLNILNNNIAGLNKEINLTNNVDPDQREYILMNTAMLQRNFKSAAIHYSNGAVINQNLFNPYSKVIEESQRIKHRSSGLAAFFSTIVPGTGKVYTGNWKDGLISGVFIGACAFQTYRGYARNEFNSAQFWIFGTVGTGFYLGNIYGSYKAAKKYNRKHEDEVVQKARMLFMGTD